MLVGDGAKKWAREHNIEEVDDDALKTESVLKSHRHYKQKLITFEKKQEVANTKFSSNISEKEYSENSFFAPKEFKSNDETISLDTVGCIVLDKFGNLATAISSGGILLKYPGRVGHSSMFGCGCYFHEERHGNSEKSSIAVCKRFKDYFTNDSETQILT
jgi:isoaspartyl peptidase/L-asparaginase-like protein (Ntn-hydrolase superfamily)